MFNFCVILSFVDPPPSPMDKYFWISIGYIVDCWQFLAGGGKIVSIALQFEFVLILVSG